MLFGLALAEMAPGVDPRAPRGQGERHGAQVVMTGHNDP